MDAQMAMELHAAAVIWTVTVMGVVTGMNMGMGMETVREIYIYWGMGMGMVMVLGMATGMAGKEVVVAELGAGRITWYVYRKIQIHKYI
jgi:hypothetical protein